MKFPRWKQIAISFAAFAVFAGAMLLGLLRVSSGAEAKAAASADADLKAFAAVGPIDAHAHFYKDDPALGALFERLNLRILNICVIDNRDPDYGGLEPQRTDVLKLRRTTHGRAVFCTTFSPYEFEQPGFAQRSIQQLDGDFANGAIAVKIYKVMGMQMKSKAGKWVFPDDPAFEPIYKDIAAHHCTVVAHIAEPDSCWKAPDPTSPDYGYYKEHPEEYAYAHPEWPAKATILAHRDHMVAMNPDLRVVGAHLGSMEVDVDQMAARFDKYPNFAVDTAARVPYFMLQSRDKVRAFLIKYQDRVLYATDLVIMPRDDTRKAVGECNDNYARDWRFFATDQTVEYNGHTYKGIALPAPVVRKIFHDNAVHWLPGILSSQTGAGK